MFVFSAIAASLAAIAVALRARETGVRTHPAPAPDATEFPPEAPSTTRRAAADVDGRPRRGSGCEPTATRPIASGTAA